MEIQGNGIFFRQRVGRLGLLSSSKVKGNPASLFHTLLKDRDLARDRESGVPEASPTFSASLPG